MKKLLTALLCAIIAVASAFGLTACGNEKGSVSVYMPDGAPALAAAQLMADENKFERHVNYEVVDASLIQGMVTGESPKADICILPVNLASKLLGTGTTYKMLGTVTHGNLFLLSANGEKITKENISSLIGKTVGVVNLAAVPGLTFKIILGDNNIGYNELGNGGQPDSNKVNLKAVTPATLTGCDYYIIAEPVASGQRNLKFSGSLQELYGTQGGYPQAVLVAKNTLIETDEAFIEKFMNAIAENAEWLLKDSTQSETIVSAIQNHLTKGLSPQFTADNLSKDVIGNCAIKFVKANDCKEEVNAFIKKLIAVNGPASEVDDGFYYSK